MGCKKYINIKECDKDLACDFCEEWIEHDATDLWNWAVDKYDSPYEVNACWGILRKLQQRGAISLKENDLKGMNIEL